ncbi:MAG: hypothetical protein A4S14_11530 [Proteobacteria bacterium SG_bin9]|nr:MAG: hypothetical protein A4S14_11530 [Proteobacteria bacterium SG_bin9]
MLRELYENPKKGILSDNAHFDIQVDEVLAGTAPTNLSAIWDNSTFGEPETMAAGPYLIALLRWPPVRDPIGTTQTSSEPTSMMVLQAPCAPPFMFDSSSELAQKTRVILRAGKQ